jgi:hypothetical protein
MMLGGFTQIISGNKNATNQQSQKIVVEEGQLFKIRIEGYRLSSVTVRNFSSIVYRGCFIIDQNE